jgi:hypothetical protein
MRGISILEAGVEMGGANLKGGLVEVILKSRYDESGGK